MFNLTKHTEKHTMTQNWERCSGRASEVIGRPAVMEAILDAVYDRWKCQTSQNFFMGGYGKQGMVQYAK